MIKAVAYQTILAWWLAFLVYQIGSKIEKGTFNLANVIVIGIITLIVILIILNRKRNRGCINCPYVKECDKRE